MAYRDRVKKLLITLSVSFLFSYASNSFANALERYYMLVFDNPAALNQIKQRQVITGFQPSLAWLSYHGTINGVHGSASAKADRYVPYFRYAQRIDDKSVMAIELQNFQSAGIGWPENSFVRQLSTELQIAFWQLTGKYSYKVNNKLWLGVGADAYRFTDSSRLANYVNGVGIYQAKFMGEAYGINAGITYFLRPITTLDFSYFSRMIVNAGGLSTFGTGVGSFSVGHFAVRPDTFLIQLANQMNPNWRAGVKLGRAFWNTNRNLILKNAVTGTINKPINWQNSWYLSLFSRYRFTDAWSGLAVLSYDEGMVKNPINNLMGYPIGTVYSMILGPIYTFAQGMFEFKPLFIYAYIPTRVASTGFVTSFGNYHANVAALDFSLTLNM